MKQAKTVILSRSFAKSGPEPFEYLERHNIAYELRRNDLPEDTEGIAASIGDAVGIITGSDVINQYVLDRCPNLKVISKHGVGLDSIDLKLAAQRNIKVSITADANFESVADMTLMMMLNILRDFSANRICSRSPSWNSTPLSHDLFGKTVGLIGYGKIGMAVARRLAGFGVELLIYDPALRSQVIQIARPVDLDTLLKMSDIVSLHAPLNEETHNMINAASIRKMKDGAVLINTSRGALVDIKALYEALISEKLSGAGLDVYPTEPPVNEPILELNNVMATSHIAAHTVEANRRMGLDAVHNLAASLHELGLIEA